MVQISPLLYVIPVISYASLSSSTPDGSRLAVRQGFDIAPGIETSPGSLLPACQSSCDVTNAFISNCSTPDCECTTSNGNQLEYCMNCLVNSFPLIESSAQSAIDGWNQDCNGTLVLGSNSGSSSGGSSSSNSTTSATSPSSSGTSSSGSGSSSPHGAAKSGSAVALGTGNTAACVVALLGIASAFLYL